MAKFNYAPIAAQAVALIQQFGTDVQVVRVDGTATGTAQAALDVGIRVTDEVVLDLSLIKYSDRICIMTPTTIDPINSDDHRVIINGISHEITQCKPVDPNGVVIIWQVVLRK